MFNKDSVVPPHYAAEHNDPASGTVLKSEKLIDCLKELSDEGDGIHRVSVFQEGPQGTDWDFEEFPNLQEAQEVYDSIYYYDDLAARVGGA